MALNMMRPKTSPGCAPGTSAVNARWRSGSSRLASKPLSDSFDANRFAESTSASLACSRWKASQWMRDYDLIRFDPRDRYRRAKLWLERNALTASCHGSPFRGYNQGREP